jgi:hypothetical protein
VLFRSRRVNTDVRQLGLRHLRPHQPVVEPEHQRIPLSAGMRRSATSRMSRRRFRTWHADQEGSHRRPVPPLRLIVVAQLCQPSTTKARSRTLHPSATRTQGGEAQQNEAIAASCQTSVQRDLRRSPSTRRRPSRASFQDALRPQVEPLKQGCCSAHHQVPRPGAIKPDRIHRPAARYSCRQFPLHTRTSVKQLACTGSPKFLKSSIVVKHL